jgi:hypothetical protein
MRRIGWAAVAITVAVVLAGARGSDAGNQQGDERRHSRGCSEATLRGDYGIQIQGTRPLLPPAPAGSIEPVIGIVIRTYDGQGNFTQRDNVKGSISGIDPPDREGFGTYQVNADCTGGHFRQIPGLPVSEDRFVIVDNGREIRHAVMSPVSVMVTGVSQKIHVR